MRGCGLSADYGWIEVECSHLQFILEAAKALPMRPFDKCFKERDLAISLGNEYGEDG